MFDLAALDLTDLLECGMALWHAGDGADSMEDAAQRTVQYLHESMRNKDTGSQALALVRVYKTHRWEDHDQEAAALTPGVRPSGVTCLTLLGTAGAEAEWNDRRSSRSHQVIPLSSPQAVRDLPMVSALFDQLGVNPHDIIGAPFLRPGVDRGCGVFYVPEAAASSYVPDQQFVTTYGIRSVLGFGGLLPDGQMFALIMFTTVPVSAHTADQCATLAFSVNLALLPFAYGKVFAEDEPLRRSASLDEVLRISDGREAALIGLVEARQRVVLEQAAELKIAAQAAEDRASALQRSQDIVVANEAFKSAILDAAMDCLIAIDSTGRVLEFNRAAEYAFGYARAEAIGRSLADLIIPERQRRAHQDGLVRYLATGQSRIVDERIELNAMRADGTELPVELAVTRAGTGEPPVFVGYLRDLRGRRAIEAQLAEEGRRSAHIARTLQTSLLPPALPDLPGWQLAASYQAAGEGYDVGGDFYDLFQIDDEDWAFTLGDVMGKGPEAAAVTALARYTLRAAAIRSRHPTDVLATLNEAMYRQYPERPCTAVYGLLHRAPTGCTATIGTGGHVPMLLRRSDGHVEEITASGLILGPFPDWEGEPQTLTLGAGDLLLAYSDGVTEARRGRELYGAERLAALLATTKDSSAEQTVRQIITEIDSFSGTRSDDMAILAVRLRAEDQPSQ